PTVHSNFVVPIHGNDAEASGHAGTARHDFGAHLDDDDDEWRMSMPRLSRYDEAAMQRELEAKRREHELMMEVERLRHERSMAEEGARQSVARAKLEFESERLRMKQDRLEQLSTVGGIASSDGSAAPATP